MTGTVILSGKAFKAELAETANELFLGSVKPEEAFAANDFSYVGPTKDNGNSGMIAEAAKNISLQMRHSIMEVAVQLTFSETEMKKMASAKNSDVRKIAYCL